MKPRDAAGYWDSQAATYDRRTAWVERKFLAGSRQWVCARATGRTLEVAIGTGANLPHYPHGAPDTVEPHSVELHCASEGQNGVAPDQSGAQFELVGLDQSPQMMARAKERAVSLGLGVDLHTGDATALPFQDGTFDSYVCTYAMCSIPDVPLALTEALRVLRPDGRLLLADHVASSNWALLGLQHVVTMFSLPLQGESYTRRPGKQLVEHGLTIVDTDRLHLGTIERIHARKQG